MDDEMDEKQPDGKRPAKNVAIDADIYDRLRARVEPEGRTLRWFVCRAVEAALDRAEQEDRARAGV